MKRILLIVGLPGSGKTHLGEKLSKEDNTVTYIDDITMNGGLETLEEAVKNDNVVISDVFLCRDHDRSSASKLLKELAPDHLVEWFFFENDPAKCLNNVNHRDDGREVAELIKELTKEYNIPEEFYPHPIWSPS